MNYESAVHDQMIEKWRWKRNDDRFQVLSRKLSDRLILKPQIMQKVIQTVTDCNLKKKFELNLSFWDLKDF